MKLLHPVNNRDAAGFSQQEKEEAKSAIYANILESMVALLEAMMGKCKLIICYNPILTTFVF